MYRQKQRLPLESSISRRLPFARSEIEVPVWFTTLEAQYKADAQKMQLLSKMKAEFANRQQADLSSLLGQLEAMRAGA